VVGLFACRGIWSLSLALAAALACLSAGLLAGVLTGAYHGAFGAAATHSYCATLRTCVLTAGALLAGWAGRRWAMPAFSHLIYPLMLLGAYRLIVEDMYQEQKAASVISLLVFGAALMVLPRLRASNG